MDTIYKIITGVALFIITSTLTYLFKKRQLYVVASALYRATPVSTDGSICQMLIYNKGNHVEEEVSVSLDPSLKIELLASDVADLFLSGNKITIPRLHKNRSVSFLILIENEIFDNGKINSITSKTTDGKIIQRITQVPPNAAKFFLAMVGLLAAAPSMIGTFYLYDYIASLNKEQHLKVEYDLGWNGLDDYYDSELRKSYGDQEFPVRYISIDNSDPRKKIVFEVYNKTAIPLMITADKNNKSKSAGIENFVDITVPPMSHSPMTVPIPDPDPSSHMPEIEFTFRSGSEFIWKIYYTVS